jgi:hypothetical protein
VFDGEAGPLGIGREVGVLREPPQERLRRRRHQPFAERDAVQQGGHALGDGSDVVPRLGPELDHTQRVAPGEVLARTVVLQHGTATANRHDGVQTAHLASLEQFVEAVTHLRHHWIELVTAI